MATQYVAYYRVSTQKQGLDGYGVAAQRDAVERYLGGADGTIIGSYQEVESGANNDRPALAEAIDHCKRAKARLIIAKLDRLSRNAAFLLNLQDAAVDFVAADMPNADRFTVGVLALVAQRERELISERTKAGLQAAKARGKQLGTPDPKAAVERMNKVRHQKVSEGRAAQLVAIRELQETGVSSYTRLADYMNKRGERTARGARFTATTVRRILVAE